jgi:hypothetical protein
MAKRIFFLFCLAAGGFFLLEIYSAQLTVSETSGRVTVMSSGEIGYPSYKIVVDRNEAGNLTKIHVPANGPDMCYKDEWLTCMPIIGPGASGWDKFRGFSVPVFQITEQSNNRVVIKTGGKSSGGGFYHYRTYMFTREGIQMNGEFIPLVTCRHVSNWGGFDYRVVHWPNVKILPVQTQGSDFWKYMFPHSRDVSTYLPPGVDYPLHAMLKFRDHPDWYINFLFDKKLDSMRDSLLYQVIYNDTKVNVIMGCWQTVAPYDTQTYQIRIHFTDSSAIVGTHRIPEPARTFVTVVQNPVNASSPIMFRINNYSNLPEMLKLRIFNLSGRLVGKYIWQDKGSTRGGIRANHNLLPGGYVLKINTNDKEFTRKVIVK